MSITSFRIPTVDITVDGHTITTPAYELNPLNSLGGPKPLGTTQLRDNVQGWYNDTYMLTVAKQIVDRPGITKQAAAEITKQAHQHMKAHLNRGLDEIRTDRGTTPTKIKTPTFSNAVLKVSTNIVNTALDLRKDQTDKKVPTYENNTNLFLRIAFGSQNTVSEATGHIFDSTIYVFNGTIWPKPIPAVPIEPSSAIDDLIEEMADSKKEMLPLVENIIKKVMSPSKISFDMSEKNEATLFGMLSRDEWKQMVENIQRLVATVSFAIAPVIPYLQKVIPDIHTQQKFVVSFIRDALLNVIKNHIFGLNRPQSLIHNSAVNIILMQEVKKILPVLFKQKRITSASELNAIADQLHFYFYSEVNTSGKFVIQELVDKLKDVDHGGNLHYEMYEDELLQCLLTQIFDETPSQQLADLIRQRNAEFYERLSKPFINTLSSINGKKGLREITTIIDHIPKNKHLSSFEKRDICTQILAICSVPRISRAIEYLRDHIRTFSGIKKKHSVKRSKFNPSRAKGASTDGTLQLLPFDELRLGAPKPDTMPPPVSVAT